MYALPSRNLLVHACALHTEPPMDQFIVLYLTCDQYRALQQHLHPDVLIERTLDEVGQVRERNPLILRATSTCRRCDRRYHTNATSPVTCPRCKQQR